MAESVARISALRRFRDRLATAAINLAGAAVIGLIALILAYLVYVASPLGLEAEVARVDTQTLDAQGAYAVAPNAVLHRLPPADPDGATAAGEVYSAGRLAVRRSGDELWLYLLEPARAAAASSAPLTVSAPILRVAVPGIRPHSLRIDAHTGAALLAYHDERDRIQVLQVDLDDTAAYPRRRWTIDEPELRRAALLPDLEGNRLLAVDGNRFLDAALDAAADEVTSWAGGTLQGVPSGTTVVGWGPARETLLLIDVEQRLHRFDAIRAGLPRLGDAQPVDFSPRWVGSESDRRVSYLLGDGGELLVMVPSAGDWLLRATVPQLDGPGLVGMTGDGAYLYRLAGDEYHRVALRNPFPETGWRSLWLPQWFAAYAGPVHVWHPDGASIGVLSKYGLTPLLYGTFKAAIYGMLMAVPLALGAAIYTGYLMPARQRNRVKPAIEMLEAVPTVVLGFIAGLWAAPLLQQHLLFVLALPLLFVSVPLLLSALHLLLQLLSPRFLRRPPRMLLLGIAYAASILLLFHYAPALEGWLFDGSVTDRVLTLFGLRYDQRNALLVGLAMGIAITPAMFSIVEDAIFAVPRSLSDGSLALGATRWQALSRIVLPAAAPALLSALLIGLARGLGETMIVLLATGNTPIMEASLLSGLRSLSASIAAELPEAGTASVQFRVLFLAALVLFALTFVLNTVAELFRQRLRYTYARR